MPPVQERLGNLAAGGDDRRGGFGREQWRDGDCGDFDRSPFDGNRGREEWGGGDFPGGWDGGWRGGRGSGRVGGPKLSGANSVSIERDFRGGHPAEFRGLRGDGGGGDERGLRRRSPPPPAAARGRGRSRSRSLERLLPPQALQHTANKPTEKSPFGQTRSPETDPHRRSRSRGSRGDSQTRPSSAVEGDEGPKKPEEGEVAEEKRDEEGEEDEEEGEAKDPPPIDAEAFSDFGESDDEILNKEAKPEEEEEEGEAKEEEEEENQATADGKEKAEEEGETQSRTREENDEGIKAIVKRKQEDGNILEGISDEDLDLSEDDEAKTVKAKMVDAIDVDWSQLMRKPTEKPPSSQGALKERWSLASIFNRIGLSKKLCGEELYNRMIEKASHPPSVPN